MFKNLQKLFIVIKSNALRVVMAWTEARVFNLMFKTFQGVTEDSSSIVYLRPETAQGIL